MNIAIIGAGNVGRALAGSGTRAGNAITISSASGSTAMAFLNISLQMRHGWSRQAGWKLVGPAGDAL